MCTEGVSLPCENCYGVSETFHEMDEAGMSDDDLDDF